MADVSPSPGFFDRFVQRMKGQRSSMSMPAKDTNLPDENPKRKKGFGRFIQSGSKADEMISGFNKVRELAKKR